MYARATTTVSILRGEETDEWGYPEDADTVVASGVIASLIEYKQYFRSEITTQPRNLRYARLRLTYRTDIQTNDRILDERTGLIWTMQNTSAVQNPVLGQDIRVDLTNAG